MSSIQVNYFQENWSSDIKAHCNNTTCYTVLQPSARAYYRGRCRRKEGKFKVRRARLPPPLSPSIPQPPLSPFFPLFFLKCKPLPPPKCNVAHHCTVAVKIVPFYRARGRANEGRARARAHSQCEALPRLLKASYYCALVFRPLSLS